jgi:hypothetical protein
MKPVDFEEVIAEAVSDLGAIDDTDLAKNFARQWAWRALQQLGTTEKQLEVCEVKAKNLLIPKPKNFKTLEAIALFDENDCFIPHIYHTGVNRIYPNLETSIYTQRGQLETPVDISESDSSFVLGTNATSVDYALIRYYTYPIDKNGLPLVREHEVEAVGNYIRWRWSRRLNQNQSEIQENKMTWMASADRCIAKKKSFDFNGEVRKRMAASLNRQIPNFNRSQF